MRKNCPECGSEELRHDTTQGETDCVDCGWSESWWREVPRPVRVKRK